MQYTPHYNLNLPGGTDIVNPLVQDNPNYTAIDTALYDNKLRVIGSATHVKTDTNHALTLGDSDINQFKFVATGDYVTGDTFTVDGVTVTPRIADESSIPTGAFKINSTVLCILDGTILNLIGLVGPLAAANVTYNNTTTGSSATNAQAALDDTYYKAGDTIKLNNSVFLGRGRGNRRTFDFIVPVMKNYGNLTPTLSGSLRITDTTNTELLATTDVLNFSASITKTGGSLLVELEYASNIFPPSSTIFVGSDLTITFS